MKQKKQVKPVKRVVKKKVKKTKIRYGRIFLTICILGLVIYLLTSLINFPIRNIIILNNENISDQEIIEMLHIENYPSIFKYSTYQMEKNLKQDLRIETANVKKKKLKIVEITIEEATPLFYNLSTGKTYLSTKEEVTDKMNAPVLLNYIPDTKYDLFIEKMLLLDEAILKRVSEIEYQPNTVDEERFLFTMSDGNYVYLTIEKFESINHYISIYADITSKYGNKKGILHLDSGDYFTILE